MATLRTVFPAGVNAATGVSPVTQACTGAAGDTGLTIHVTVSAGTDTGMTVAVNVNGAPATATAPLGPNSHSNQQNAGFQQPFHILNPPTSGSYNVVATVSGGTPDAVGVKVYVVTGSDGTAPTGTLFAPNDTTNRTAFTITSPVMPSGALGISGFCTGSAFSGTGQTNQLNAAIGGASAAVAMAGATAAGAGAAVAFTATATAADWHACFVTVWDSGTGGPVLDQVAYDPAAVHPPGLFTPAGQLTAWQGVDDAPPQPVGSFLSDSAPATDSTVAGVTLARAVSDSAPATDGTQGALPATTWFTSIGGSTPVLVASNEDWALLPNGTVNNAGNYQTTFDNYFTTRAAQGYNAVEVSLFSYPGIFSGTATNLDDSDGVFPFVTNSNNPSNGRTTAFWDRRDYFFSSASSHGFRVYVNLTTPWLSAGAATTSWTTAQWTALGNHLAAKYPASTHPHVHWIVGDDYFGEKETEIAALRTAMRAGGCTQPMTIQWYQEASSRKNIWDGTDLTTLSPSWAGNADLNWGYSYNPSYDVVEKMGNEANPIPYGWFDGFFLNSGTTTITDQQLMRRMIWWALSSGAKAVQTGNNTVYPWDSTAYAEVTSNTFYTTTMPAILAAFRALPKWHLLKADTSSQLVTAGRGTHVSAIVSGGSGTPYTSNSDAYVTASFIQSGADAGKLAVIYMSHGSTITIDQTKMVAGYTATWVDPASGATSTATPGTTYNSTAKGNNSDGQADWVLVLAAPTGNRALSDSAPATDATTRVLSLPRPRSDSAPATDAVARSSAYARTAGDTAAATDSTTASVSRFRAVSDAAPATDATARALTLPRPVSDTGAGSDTAARGLVLARTPSDSAPATDGTAGSTGGGLGRSVSDAAPATDATSRALTLARARSDAAPATDGTARAVTLPRSLSDTAAATDATAAKTVTARAVPDSAPATDVTVGNVGRSRAVADSAPATDGTTRARMLPRALADTGAGTDTSARATVAQRAISDAAPASDTTAGSTGGNQARSVVDSAPATAGLVRQVVLARSLADTGGGTDSSTQRLTYARALTNLAPAADLAARALRTFRVAGDIAHATDTTVAVFTQAPDYILLDIQVGIRPRPYVGDVTDPRDSMDVRGAPEAVTIKPRAIAAGIRKRRYEA